MRFSMRNRLLSFQIQKSPAGYVVSWAFLFFFLFALNVNIYSQNTINNSVGRSTGTTALTGTFSVGPSGTYSNLTSALEALTTDGISGPVILELQATYVSTGETFPLTFSNFTGLNATNTLTVRPETGATGLTITGLIASTQVIDLNNAAYVTFDGRPGGSGSAKELTISSLNTTGQAVRFINDATHNVLKYLTVQGIITTTTSGVILFSTTTGTTGNDNNTIDNCSLTAGATTPANIVYSAGTTSTTTLNNSNNTISNNLISNYFASGSVSAGILVSSGSTDWTISANHLFQTATRTSTVGNSHYGISVITGNNHTISGNYIGGSTTSTGGTAWTIAGGFANRFVGIQLTAGTTTASSIQGNFIRNFSISTTSGASSTPGVFCGIFNNGSWANIGTITGNTIGSETGTGSITVTTSTSGAMSMGIAIGTATARGMVENNKIGSLSLTGSTTSIGHNFVGIEVTSFTTGQTVTINLNLIGSLTTANSIRCTNAVTGTVNQSLTGIRISSGNPVGVITNNTIANLDNAAVSSGAATYVRGIAVGGVGSAHTITGNTIRNLSTTATNVSGSVSAVLQGIATGSTNSTLSQSISNNVIHSLINTNTTVGVSVIGIVANWTSIVTALTCSNNFVHSLRTSGLAGSNLFGIYIGAGTAAYSNNMVRLGLDESGNSLTIGQNIAGINEVLGTNTIVHNSVYIGGTGVASTNNTFAFLAQQTTNTRVFRNNIFVNDRQNASGTAINGAAQFSGTFPNAAGLTLDNNLYYASIAVNTIRAGTSTYTLAAWKTYSNADGNSGVAPDLTAINFVNPAGTSSTVDLHLQGTTAAEGAGFNISSVTTDFDGQTRSGLTPVDIGADAGNFTQLDIFPPSISFSALGNTANLTARTLTTTITDASGVPTTGAGLPVLYWKIGAGSYSAVTATYVSGNDYSFGFGGGVVVLDTVYYYIVAQDLAGTPNVIVSPSTGASGLTANPPAVSAAPTSPGYYLVLAGASGTITVGTGGDYTNLTGTAGAFNKINTSVVNGNIKLAIISDLIETGEVALNDYSSEYLIEIRPRGSSVLRNIEGTTIAASTPMLNFNGADRVTINGADSATNSGQFLRFINNHLTPANTGNVMVFKNDARGNYLKNCILESNSTTAANAVILLSTTTGTLGNDSIFVDNCLFRASSGTNPGRYFLAYSSAGSGSIGTVRNSDNFILNSSFTGMLATSTNVISISGTGNGDNWTISNNKIYNDLIFTIAHSAVLVSNTNTNNVLISGNSIGGSNPDRSGTFYGSSVSNYPLRGIQLLVGNTTASSVQGNFFSNAGCNTLVGTTSSAFFLDITGGKVNIGTVTGNTVGGGANPWDTVITAYDNGWINCSSSDSITIENNLIGNANYWRGVNDRNSGITTLGSGVYIIRNNVIRDIKGNSAAGSTVSSFSIYGIFSNSTSSGSIIEGNTIYNIVSFKDTNYVNFAAAVRIGGAQTNTLIQNNRIYNILATNSATGANSPSVFGISASNVGATLTILNNQISLSQTGNEANLYGIYTAGTTLPSTVQYNSVYIGGSATGSTSISYGFYRNAAGSDSVSNNLFYNARTGALANCAIGTGVASTWNTTNSNNTFISSDPAQTGRFAGTNYTFDDWKTNSGGDKYSFSEVTANIPAASLFTDYTIGNMNINTAYAGSWIIAGKGKAVSGLGSRGFDYSGNTRVTSSLSGTTCIGSHEFSLSGLPATPAATLTSSIAVTSAQDIIAYGKIVGTITWLSGTSLPSAIQVKYITGKQHPSVTGGYGSNAYWTVTPTGGTDYTYSITLNYDPSSIGQVDETLLKLAKWDGSAWIYYDGATSNTTNKTVNATGLNSFSDFVLTSSDNPLPVELVNFSAKTKNRNVILSWETKTEIDNFGFEIERKDKSGTWIKTGFVEGNGTSNSPKYYNFEEKKLASCKHSYRLKQIDNNGSFEYSDEVEVAIDVPTEFAMSQNYPNPFNPSTKVDYQLAENAKVTIELYGMTGERVAVLVSEEQEAGYYTMMIDAYKHQLASGIYIYRMIATDALGKNFIATKKLSLIK
jgi:hypothetical protein